ncbi:magnesium transporter [Billgrantia kenyensis]|uniref:Magnesium transporter n=1 Tax=Billgrantia kenyensis TaxID=321266 RepID=A0A7W0ACC0_9GAMM|nr:magnesium transporter [Halomonas kenyensis]MBA2777833.1 magnesium transporter [Halomonas kenyensis]MCG6661304.1 magnesium transporter [Halomonas kenyensis]
MATQVLTLEKAAGGEKLVHPISNSMRQTFLRVNRATPATDVLDMVKWSELPEEMLSLIFVHGDDGKHLGFVRLTALLRAKPDLPVHYLLQGESLFASETTDQEEAARLLQKHDIALLPILGESGAMRGVLTFDDAMDILDEETSEDIYWKAGVGDVTHLQDAVRSEKLTSGGIGYPVKVRLMFLMVTLAGGMLVGGVIDHFEGVLESLVALAIFIPLVMDMGGNVGTQSTTIFARGLALGHIDLKQFFRKHLLRELRVGLVMGVLLATLAGIIAWAWQGAPNGIPMLGVVVGVSLFVSVVTASVLGFLLPYIMLKIGVDHAPGADPFITTIKDFTGLAVYFLMAGWLLGISG